MIRVGVSVGSFSASGGGASFDADAQAFFDRVTTEPEVRVIEEI